MCCPVFYCMFQLSGGFVGRRASNRGFIVIVWFRVVCVPLFPNVTLHTAYTPQSSKFLLTAESQLMSRHHHHHLAITRLPTFQSQKNGTQLAR